MTLGYDTLLHGTATATRDAYALLRSIIDTDGALPASLKRTYVAAAAATRRSDALTRDEARGAAAAGVTGDVVSGALSNLLSVKGIVAARIFSDAFIAAGVPPVPGEAAAASRARAPDDVGAYLRDYFGDPLPPHLAALEQLDERALRVYFLFRRGALDDNPLAGRAAELLFCVVSAADYAVADATVHARGARRAGATDAELVEAMLCAVPVSGLSAWARAGEAILYSRPSADGDGGRQP